MSDKEEIKEPQTPENSPPPLSPRTPSFSPPETSEDKVDEKINDIVEEEIQTKKGKKLLVKNDDKKRSKFDVFIKCISSDKISLSVSNIGGNISNIIKTILSKKLEGKCGENGYIKEGSVELINYSNGICKASNVIFDVVYQCEVCNPVQGMSIECIVKNITKAGIRAELEGFENSPLVIFVARDHHYSVKDFSSINEDDRIHIKVVGQRFELNDKYVSVIAELDLKEMIKKQGGKQRISIME